MYREDHGGSCCGITHISDFSGATVERLTSLIDAQVRDMVAEANYDFDEDEPERAKVETWNHLFEVVLTDAQMMVWAQDLKTYGFKLVTRFKNSNSGNYCNVLHYSTAEPRGRNRSPRPYTW